MGDLRFIEDPHSYLHDGKPMAGLTSALAAEGYIKNGFYTDEGKDRGTAVALGCEDYNRGGSDWRRLPADYLPYVHAWEEYCEVHLFNPSHIEQPVHSHIHQFATKPDAIGPDKDNECVVVEVKTGASEPWHPLQTAAQALAYAEEHNIPLHTIRRRAVILMPTGKHRPVPHDDRRDYEIVRAMFLLHHDKHNRRGG